MPDPPRQREDRAVNRRPKEDVMQAVPLLDRAGRRRSPATTSNFHQGVPPHNKGLRYPPDPPTVDEIIAVMRTAGNGPDGIRLRGVIVVLWRAGLRISEALALNETDLDADRGALLVRHGKGDAAMARSSTAWRRKDSPALLSVDACSCPGPVASQARGGVAIVAGSRTQGMSATYPSWARGASDLYVLLVRSAGYLWLASLTRLSVMRCRGTVCLTCMSCPCM
jgi:hypothetical protein